MGFYYYYYSNLKKELKDEAFLFFFLLFNSHLVTMLYVIPVCHPDNINKLPFEAINHILSRFFYLIFIFCLIKIQRCNGFPKLPSKLPSK